MGRLGRQSASKPDHPYLAGNFAPVTNTTPPVPVSYTGSIPKDLHGGMYVRNGGNPISNSNLGRDAHWFDGDGMLTGVWFKPAKTGNRDHHAPAVPHFVNQFVLTDLCISSLNNTSLATPILPSIATLVNPLESLLVIIWRILRAAFLVFLSHLPYSPNPITRISVANTSIVYHDGRALATCESGPPIRVQLPGLETVGWYNGNYAENEHVPQSLKKEPGFGGTGLNSWMREWTTGHPKVDPVTGEMMLFHCSFLPPFVHYSIVPRESSPTTTTKPLSKLLNAPVPGCSGGKMMHDFGVSTHHTVILDLPLTLSPFNLLKNQPIVSYEPHKPSRFGIFPRRNPSAVRWFETTGCCIFHTANTWDELDDRGNPIAVNMLACRLTSATLVFSAGNITPPVPPESPGTDTSKQRRLSFFAKYDDDDRASVDVEKVNGLNDKGEERTPLLAANHSRHQPISSTSCGEDDEEQCRLYFYRFSLKPHSKNVITHQHALATIPFEFPTLHPGREMQSARYIYGCSTSSASFGAALGKATKIDVLVKMDVTSLLSRKPTGDAIDRRSMTEILESKNPNDAIQAFKLPPNCYAQEARFVPRSTPPSSSSATTLDDDDPHHHREDNGYLLFYVFDESQLTPSPPATPSPDEADRMLDRATSELWILDARDMRTVVCKMHLPSRVPYGLHGNWFDEASVEGQREVAAFRELVS